MSKDALDEAGRVASNTHPSAHLDKSVCIDYLKFRFDYNYSNSHDTFKNLINILSIDQTEISLTKGYNNYKHAAILAPGIILLYGGEKTVAKLGQATSLLEIKGQGCREFEYLYYISHKDSRKDSKEDIFREGWIKLLEECLALEGKCTRIDLPTDDYSGLISMDEIQSKIAKKEYATRMKKLEEIESNVEKEDDDDEGFKRPDKLRGVVKTHKNKQKGYSATFGNRDHVQLCIYDKKAEQTNKGNPVDSDYWIRYEVRYYHENAENEINFLLNALREKQETKHIVACLAGIFEFKESNGFNERHRSYAKVWDKWSTFIGDAGKQATFSNSKETSTMQTNCSWLVRCASLCFARVVLSMDAPSLETFYALLVKGVSNLTEKDLQQINKQIRKNGGKPFTSVREIKEAVIRDEQFPDSFSDNVVRYILSVKPKKEANKDEKKA